MISHVTDVLVIGAGAAGLRAAIAVDQQHVRVLVVGKRPRDDAHTLLASGGINAALATMDPEDNWAVHAADTLREGRFLGDPRAVELMCQEAPHAIEELMSFGAEFARRPDGRLAQRYFGAHRYRRTAFAGDYTGRVVLDALLAEVDRRAIAILQNVYISDLLTDSGRITGAVGFRLDDGAHVKFDATAVVLATGGHTRVYRRSTSRPAENTGDGMAMALRVGAQLADMELVQFHPTGMVWPSEAEGTLVTEAVRGEGGRLYNGRWERFMIHSDPERLELSSRDRVALANYTEIIEGRGTIRGGVWLNVSHLPADVIHERLPRMVEQFRAVGVDITREAMEVAPTAHYSMGGVRVDPTTHTTRIPGLLAAGEVAAGVHGANRLGGNSLLECVVFGRRAGEAAAAFARFGPSVRDDPEQLACELARLDRAARLNDLVLRALTAELQQVMWLRCGIVRDANGLAIAAAEIVKLRGQLEDLPSRGEPNPRTLAAALDLDSLLLTAEATVRSAWWRTESRGAHQRRDFPATDPNWQRTIVLSGQPGQLQLSTLPLPPPSPAVAEALEDLREPTAVEHLLE